MPNKTEEFKAVGEKSPRADERVHHNKRYEMSSVHRAALAHPCWIDSGDSGRG